MISKLSAGTLTELAKQQIGTDFVYMPQVHERFGGEIRRLGRAVEAARDRQTVVRVGGSLIMLGNECVSPALESPCKPFIFEQWPGGAGHVKPVGVADLKVVQTQLYRYEAGEVAHVENILQGEVRKRTFRDLSRQEVTTEQEQETTTENEKETQTTERFELHKEASNVLQENQASQAGATVTAAYGTVSGTVSGSISSSTSQMQANAQATTYAKEVMDRALQRVIEKTRTKRTVTTIVENEQTTEHEFNNTATGAGGTDHITGVYRWLDKVYYNKVVNYGRRMMFEFVVPEPAAFHLFSKLSKPKSNEVIEAPPPFTITSFEEIDPQTYDGYAVQYGAVGVKPPTTIQTVQWARDFWPGPGDTASKTFKETITIPEGFVATSAKVTFLITSAANHYITVSVGGSAALTRYTSDVVDILDLTQASGRYR
ncbi:MAG: hypothetical protein IPF41_15550 [Flavobacteriales bacterium]|nr:hypothetical protein [Flavobacteriales bacterium]